MKRSLKQLQARIVSILLDAVPNCQVIYCFGSWGTDAELPDSDIDLAILQPHPLETFHRWELAQALASVALRDVDLVDLATASTVLRMQVVAYGERLYCADVVAAEQFEDSVFSRYAHLNEERKGILADVHQRGRIYAE